MSLGAYCINPLNGEQVPIWVANYVLMEYGTGAVMGVPAHDQRDFEFARKYGLPIRVVISPPKTELKADDMTEAYVDPGLLVNSGPFNGLPNEEAQEKINTYLKEEGWGEPSVTYRLRDWLVSRQRYWVHPYHYLLPSLRLGAGTGNRPAGVTAGAHYLDPGLISPLAHVAELWRPPVRNVAGRPGAKPIPWILLLLFLVLFPLL